ncbi:MAG: exo-alpha-sialidase [Spirochaetes bacterium]|nr:exo-alpha-sialidase [Spirochaetota bacterium]
MTMLLTDKNRLHDFYSDNRKWQGIPGIERTKKGRIFATFYSGGVTEELGNYCLLVTSDDDGRTWSEPVAVAYKGDDYRCYDPCLWIDPLGRLWFIWSVMPEHAVWASVCDNPDAEELVWSTPRIIGNDIMMNKPTVLSGGEWLFPIAIWNTGVHVVPGAVSHDELRRSFVYRSTDNGQHFTRIGGADVPERTFDEHMVLELKDGRLLMLVRTAYGIGRSYSSDRGVSWTPGEDSGIKGPNSRFFIRRLRSGNILLINHHNFSGRNNLTAMLSRDECRTWEGFLMLDERQSVSYPDAVETDDGVIYAVYDRERGAMYSNDVVPGQQAREILMARFTERDILAGKIIDKNSALKITVSRLGGIS